MCKSTIGDYLVIPLSFEGWGDESFASPLAFVTTFKRQMTRPRQLSGYLTTRGLDEGYLITFDFSKDKQAVEPQWIEWNGKQLFEVII